MVQVTELSYMGIGVTDPDAWKNFASRIIGMELAEDEKRDRCYLRMDYWHHRIVLHAHDSDDLMYLGFRVAGPQEFREMQQQLSSAKIEFRVGSDDETVERQTGDGLLHIRMEPLDAHTRAQIQTDAGIFAGRDHLLTVTVISPDAEP